MSACLLGQVTSLDLRSTKRSLALLQAHAATAVKPLTWVPLQDASCINRQCQVFFCQSKCITVIVWRLALDLVACKRTKRPNFCIRLIKCCCCRRPVLVQGTKLWGNLVRAVTRKNHYLGSTLRNVPHSHGSSLAWPRVSRGQGSRCDALCPAYMCSHPYM